ncbi:hypothetical protein PaG_04919 [Moesziomyces aphidis]|uniref:Rab-GAP TBC domain-containing protein n=1 Tax=Moesziomyces aphidis TaxID=84754 RepID=W3VJK1_MOEAP|nr:hypothetical protein PaG_04919 [Moesziomyces aphidis]
MSSSQPRAGDPSLLHLLDPNDLLPGHTTADLYSLRHFTLRGGLPDSPSWLRAQAWKVLLGYLPPEKKEWPSVLAKRRREYYQFLSDLSPSSSSTQQPIPSHEITSNDRLLDQIYKDVVRSRKNGFAFYQASPTASASCPIVPAPPADEDQPGTSIGRVQRLAAKDNLLHRLAAVSPEYRQQLMLERTTSTTTTSSSSSNGSRPPPHVLHLNSSLSVSTALNLAANGAPDTSLEPIKSPPIVLSPPSPGGLSRESSRQSFTSADDALQSSTHGSHQDADNRHASKSAIFDAGNQPQDSVHGERNWHSLVRILYIFALLNPSIGYVQGMNEALFILLYVFGSAQYPSATSASIASSISQQSIAAADGDRPWDNDADLADTTSHAEADAFWCFSTLVGEMRELYDFERVEQQSRAGAALVADHQPSQTGMAGALLRFSLRIKWLDPPLWRDLRASSLDPRLPYYSLRWLACLLSTELSLPSVLRIWDALLAEQDSNSVSGSAKIEFLIDVCASMILHIKPLLPSSEGGQQLESEGFSAGMRVLQAYPDDDVAPVVEAATLVRQRRLAADLTGDGPPTELDDGEDSNATLAAVKARAAQAWREWKNPTPSSPATPVRTVPQADSGTPTTKGGWLVSRARARPSLSAEDADTSITSSADGDTSDLSTASKSSFSGFLAKYAEAMQSSDAAANLSKASTNLTAKALARFGDRSSRESTPEASVPHQRYGSLGRGLPLSPPPSESGAGDSRVATIGAIGASFFGRKRTHTVEGRSQSVNSPRTPDMTRWSRDTMPDFPLPNVSDSPAGRMDYVNAFGKRLSVAANGRSMASPASSVAGDDSGERRVSESAGSVALPSMRAAARMGILPARYREESASPRAAAGPKPLLLSQAARPPREGSSAGTLTVDEPSRKISSGPMGHSMSRENSHETRSNTSASFSRRSSRSTSVADSRRSSMVDFADAGMPGLAEPDTLPPLPSLTGQSAAATLPSRSGSFASDAGRPIVLQGGAKDGVVSAGAFARATKVEERPEFGQVASSSDVPLVTGASIGRPRGANRQRTSSSTVESAVSTSGSLGNRVSNRSSQTTNADASVAPVLNEELVDEPGGMEDGGADEWKPGHAVALTETTEEAVRKYTLTDEPTTKEPPSVGGLVRTKRYVKNRQMSTASTASTARRSALRLSNRSSLDPTANEEDAEAGVEAGVDSLALNGADPPRAPTPSTDRSTFI